MIRRLRVRFVLVNMAFVTVMLAAIFAPEGAAIFYIVSLLG